MRKFLVLKKVLVFVVLFAFVGIMWSADSDAKFPRDYDGGVWIDNLDFLGVNYKIVDQTTSQTAITTLPAICYGIVFSSGASSDDYVIVYDSTTASTNGEIFTIIVDTITVTSAGNPRIITFPYPVQAGKGIYVKNSDVTFKTTTLYRPMR